MNNLGLAESKDLIFRDTCILAGRSIGDYEDNYSNMLKFVAGSKDGRAVVEFLKCYPDEYRKDGIARRIIDGYIASNADTAYAIHAKALSEYLLLKDGFKAKYKTDLISAISIKNKEYAAYKKCEERANAYANKFGDEAEEIFASKSKEAQSHLGQVKGIQERLGAKGLAVESLLAQASEKYSELADSQESYDALISRGASLAIRHSLGTADQIDISYMSYMFCKAEQKRPTVEVLYSGIMFDYVTEPKKTEDNMIHMVAENLGGIELSNVGIDCINAGAEIIANFENQDAPVNE